MKVKELIEALRKCGDDLEVTYRLQQQNLITVLPVVSVTKTQSCNVDKEEKEWVYTVELANDGRLT